MTVYAERRVAILGVFGFASGLPLALVFATLSAWLAEAGISKTVIGLFAWASTAYTVKFLWSPMVDRVPVPLLTRWLGQRRAWLLLSQLGVIGAIVGLGAMDPARSLEWMALWAVILAFASATQDIVADAYRVESLEEEQLAAGAAIFVFGYRVAMLASGGGALIIASFAGWFWAYAVMAGLMGLGIVATLISPEPARGAVDGDVDDVGAPWPVRAWRQVRGAVIEPFVDFMTRPGWLLVLIFIVLYKYGDALLGNMANPFYIETGFSTAEIGVISKTWGLVTTLAGGLVGGAFAARYGVLKALLVGGILQMASNPVFALQAWVGYSVPMLTATIAVENFTGGMATMAFVAYLSSLCNVAYTATQYALLSSLAAFARTILSSGGGWLADQVDWVSYFLITAAAALPGLALLVWLIRRYPPPHVRRNTEEPAAGIA
ncbi:MAG: AmpG family muropeptide MFS transporter [Rhodospirillales bacterium]